LLGARVTKSKDVSQISKLTDVWTEKTETERAGGSYVAQIFYVSSHDM